LITFATILSLNYTLLSTLGLILLAILALFFFISNYVNLDRMDEIIKEGEAFRKHHFETRQALVDTQRELYLVRNELQSLDLNYQEEFRIWKLEHEKEIRKDANKRSRHVLRGKVTEHLAPLMIEDIPLEDYRFMGAPIDFIIFKGASAVNDIPDQIIEEIILLDIKTGKASLSKVQRRIRDAIINQRFCFAVYNPDTEKFRRWECKKEDT